MIPKNGKGWSPYVAGALSGLLIILSVWMTGKYFSASNSFIRTAGMVEKAVGPERTAHMSYFKKYSPAPDWEWMFVVGIFIGSFISAVTSGSFQWKGVPDMWAARFGPSPVRRGVVAFIGGLVVIFGARLAGG